jgi:hypothetical protein
MVAASARNRFHNTVYEAYLPSNTHLLAREPDSRIDKRRPFGYVDDEFHMPGLGCPSADETAEQWLPPGP